MNLSTYVLLTTAKNESANIEKTIFSVINQTELPKLWLIVNDGSIDKTKEIIEYYLKKHTYIKMLNLTSQNIRDFKSKVNAINLGYKELTDFEYDLIGILDADISLDKNYYASIIHAFNRNPKLGLAGGFIFDVLNGKPVKWVARLDSVGGGIQMFRKQCFKQIGGFIPNEFGGEDAIAEYMVRMHGWQVQTFSELSVFHHRRMGTEERGIYRARYFQGQRDYLIGYHPLFEIAKCLRRIVERPYFFGSIMWLIGYFVALVTKKRTVSKKVIEYIQKEQIALLLKPSSIIRIIGNK